MRSCECTLLARVVENTGLTVQEAKSGLFTLMDSRNKLNRKHHPPSLLDFVWRLENISRNGALHKRLNETQIITVKDFLIKLFQDPENLRKILDTNATTWKILIDHAQTCTIDDEKVHSYPYGEGETVVVFDVVGRLKGILRNFQYILVENLSEIEKGDMLKCIESAFKQWERVVTFDNEASLVHCLSQILNVPRLGSPNGWNMDMDHRQPSTSPLLRCVSRTTSFGYCGSLSPLNNLDDQAMGSLDQIPNYPTFDNGIVIEDTWLLSFNNDWHPSPEGHGHQQSNTSEEGPPSKKAKTRWRTVAFSVSRGL